MPISVVEPVSPAIERTKKVLFQPFDFGKWLCLGFCAFLAYLGEGGGPSFFQGGGQGGGGGGQGGQGGPNFDQIHDSIMDHLGLIIAVAVAVIVFALALGLLFTWLSLRGKFMFLDGVVHNRGNVVAPWHEFRPEGNSLFVFRILFGLGSFAVFLVVVALALALAWSDIKAQAFGPGAVAALLLGIGLLLTWAILVSIVELFLQDFVVPIMYLRRVRVLEAWSVLRHELLGGHGGTFVLYVLFKIVIGFVVGMIAAVLVLCTCCIAAIPYVGSVVLLPVLVFNRSYPLYFIEQFGPDWRVFPHRRVREDEDLGDEEEGGEEEGPPDESPPQDDRITPA